MYLHLYLYLYLYLHLYLYSHLYFYRAKPWLRLGRPISAPFYREVPTQIKDWYRARPFYLCGHKIAPSKPAEKINSTLFIARAPPDLITNMEKSDNKYGIFSLLKSCGRAVCCGGRIWLDRPLAPYFVQLTTGFRQFCRNIEQLQNSASVQLRIMVIEK